MKKILLICLSLVLALGTLGVGFALWSETLYIDGTVNTGELSVYWTQGVPWDDEPVEKDFSWAECEIIGDTLYIYIHNAYPSITYHIPIDVHNDGTIPFHLCGIVMTGGTLPAGSTVTFPDWECYQVHPGFGEVGEITVHLSNEAVYNAIYFFTAELTVVQWNEACPVPA